MRLINVNTLEVEEFFDIHVPEYAILSHTWADGEVSLQDWSNRENRRFKPGFHKISRACQQTAKDGLAYLWVDTNCIDKTSSAELSEAINSMYVWYRRSQVCYAFLVDVPWTTLGQCKETDSDFRKSKWFTRGWTLQELIAPEVVRFFAQDWQELGTRAQLALPITETTGIGIWCLVRGNISTSNPLRRYSIAQKLSWASRRSTTRVEDHAYSLLGLFDIHMPLIYGEGVDAFRRLLEVIIRNYTDQSILTSRLTYVDYLPRSPREFCDSQYVNVASSLRLKRFYSPDSHSFPFQMTNSGMQMTLPLVSTLSPNFVFGVLNCWDIDSEINQSSRVISRIWIPLLRRGPHKIFQFTRLMWPHPFVSVRLIPSNVASKVGETTELDELAEKVGEDSKQSKKVIDLMTSESYTDILIKKPYATIIRVPRWKPRKAGSPYLICFPRGTANYRVFGIFPHEDASVEPVNGPENMTLPLIFPSKVNSNSKNLTDVYSATIVFKKRKSKPIQYVAIQFANLPSKESNEYTPSCKILPHWTPARSEEESMVLDTEAFRVTDVNEDIIVTIQKIPCSNMGTPLIPGDIHHVGLTQIVFDRRKLCLENEESQEMNVKTTNNLMAHMGIELSDIEDIGVAEEES